MEYDSDDTFFTGNLHNLNTPAFNRINRTEKGKRTDFKQHFIEVIGNKCYVPMRNFVLCLKINT